MPLIKRSELRVVVSSDLKGLGATEGPAFTYDWAPPSMLPQLVPWLAMLALLAFKPNRSVRAWWIWVPLGGVVATVFYGVAPLLSKTSPGAPTAVVEGACNSLAFGVAAVWVLAPYLQHRLRFVSFLKMFLVCGVVTALVMWIRAE
ncbi:MAG TPA: hypothetical protein VEC99_15610, partial [Clostridia bacterium]|nr:hypothetical protein [Clostridia bacterium]